MKRVFRLFLLGSALILSACAEEPTGAGAEMPAAEPVAQTDAPGDLMAVAHDDPDLSAMVIAITAAGLGETLATGGPYTIFAPTDQAFGALSEPGFDELIMPANQEQLSRIVRYHVVEGERMAAALAEATLLDGGETALTTLNGVTLIVADEAGNLVLTGPAGGTATITRSDIDASNGVIHVIDQVLTPS